MIIGHIHLSPASTKLFSFYHVTIFIQFSIHGLICISIGDTTVLHLSISILSQSQLLQCCPSCDKICCCWSILSCVHYGFLSKSWANCHVRWMANQFMLPGTLLCTFAWECCLGFQVLLPPKYNLGMRVFSHPQCNARQSVTHLTTKVLVAPKI